MVVPAMELVPLLPSESLRYIRLVAREAAIGVSVGCTRTVDFGLRVTRGYAVLRVICNKNLDSRLNAFGLETLSGITKRSSMAATCSAAA